ncbi:MAG TPA: DUF2520 domain-containing protein [Gammaproteobacteria bacterium]|nr:DUF2520 domain-containing protein [Gammaproteobacteria bacterium]
MAMLSVNFIGCGKLGVTLASLFKKHKALKIAGIVNTQLASAEAAAKKIGQGKAYADIASLKPADITIIATQDDAITGVVNALATTHAFKENAVVLHCSGALTSDALAILRDKNVAVASVHPVRSFATIETAIAEFKGTFCSMEGDALAKTTLTPLFEKIGGIVFELDKKLKPRYHAASVIANNYSTTLHYHATLAYVESGIEPALAKQLASTLMQQGLNNLEANDHENALTGPLQRNDQQTITSHFQTLAKLPALQMTKALYAALLLATLPITPHDETTRKEWVNKVFSIPEVTF